MRHSVPQNPAHQPYPPTAPLPSRGWWARLDPLPKALLIVAGVTTAVCFVPVVVVGAIGATVSPPADPTTHARQGLAGNPALTDTKTTQSSTTPAPTATSTPQPTPSPAPALTAPSVPVNPPGPPKPKTTTKPPTKKPTTTKPSGGGDCHPSYTGACVPFASDVDCLGGDGDGPAYVAGPIRVVGPDVYRLDSDGDGLACDK